MSDTELRLKLDSALISDINKNLGNKNLSASDIAREAIAVYKWVVDQTHDGNVVVASNQDGTHFTEIATPNLHAAKATRADK